MAKHIPYRPVIYRFDRHPLKVPKRDDDAGLVPENPEAPKDEQTIAYESADTIKLIRHILYSVFRSIQATSDGANGPAVHNDLLNAEEELKHAHSDAAKSKIRVKMRDADYDWFHRLLNREVPPSKADKDDGVTDKQSFARRLFSSFSADVVVRQLKDIDEWPLARDIFEVPDGSEDKDLDKEDKGDQSADE